jgi:hypothetical protein
MTISLIGEKVNKFPQEIINLISETPDQVECDGTCRQLHSKDMNMEKMCHSLSVLVKPKKSVLPHDIFLSYKDLRLDQTR